MRVAYLTSHYPKTSHSFIRREIAAIERKGIEVLRHSVRPVGEKLVDADDIAELGRTRVILGSGALSVYASALLVALRRPRRWFDALLCTFQIGWHSERGLLRHMAYLCEACHLLRALEQQRAEHLHAHFETNAAAIALLTHRLGGPPFSFTVHNPGGARHPGLTTLARKIREARFIVAVSHNARGQLMRESQSSNWSKIFVVHCGLDALFLQQPQVPLPKERRIVCVGRMAIEKGHLVLLEAAAQLASEGVEFELELIGDGPMRAEIEQAIRTFKLERRVKLSGWLGSDGVRQRILASRVLVLPSFAEGLPVVFMEALALGRPVIATYLGGIPELVVNGENGWVVPSSSVESLVRAMREAITAPDAVLSRMGERGRERVLAEHDIDAEANLLARLFQRGPDGPARPAMVEPEKAARRPQAPDASPSVPG